MAKNDPASNAMPRLNVSRDEARRLLQQQVERGKALLDLEIKSEDELSEARKEKTKLGEYVNVLLLKIFSNDSVAKRFGTGWGATASMRPVSLAQKVKWHKDAVKSTLSDVESIVERLDLYDEPNNAHAPVISTAVGSGEKDTVFIVHGHNNELRLEVTRTVEKLGFKAIVLHEQPNGGRTIIEKLEQHTLAGFAVVLMTGDDIGASAAVMKEVKPGDASPLRPRARQNVVLELGVFIGAIGRSNTFILYEEGVEIPSDISGVVWHPIDKNGAWKYQLAKELREAGFVVDMNKLG
jgi:predicted nucleotide-binding protein